jgi:acyl-homoserine lactone synthase
MIYVLSGQDAARYASLMDQVYRLRHRVCAEELGRADLAKTCGFERDQSERPDSVHHIWVRGGEVAGYLRMLPTVGPRTRTRAASARFPRGLDTFELTRYCIAPAWREEGCGTASELIAGLVEWGLACRVNKVIAEMATAWVFRALQLKFKISALHAEGDERVAMLVEYDASVLEGIRAYRKHWEPVVVFLGEHEAKRPVPSV